MEKYSHFLTQLSKLEELKADNENILCNIALYVNTKYNSG